MPKTMRIGSTVRQMVTSTIKSIGKAEPLTKSGQPRSHRSGADSGLYDHTWRKLRLRHLQSSPLCVDCHAIGVVKPADMVDHRVPIKVAPERRLDPTNLVSQCWHHHAKKTARDRMIYG
jgi:5-methylcytosine-specific restriction endonuclease McrA